MFKKTLISLAVASSVGLTGCFDSAGSGSSNANPDYQISNPETDGRTWPLFNPITGDLPIPNDLIFRSDNPATTISEADGSFSVADSSPPVTTALNQLSGASTVAPPVVQFNGQIDADSVDSRAFIFADPNDPTSLIPNPNQNVFLIELQYAGGDPVRGLGAGESPTIPLAITAQVAAGAAPQDLSGRDQAQAGAYLGSLAQSPDYVAEVVTLDGDSAIRINPTKPLNPFKRYIVVVTNEVLDINGDPIISSPLYTDVSDPDAVLGNPTALAPVRQIVDGFWEKVAASFFGVPNQARPGNALTEDDIAMSYSFTTSNDQRVLQYIADPKAFFKETILGSVRFDAVTDAREGGETDFFALYTIGNNAVAAADTTADAQADGLVGAFTTANLLPTPEDQSSTASFGTPQDVTQVSAVAGQFVDFGQVNLVQGTIDLPYYLGVPTGSSDAEGSVINTQSWTANAALAAAAGDQLGVSLAQSNPTVSQVVNYRFPFPAETQKVTVPIMVFYPAGYDGSTPLETVMYMHGITTDRSAALTFGSALAHNSQVAVVVIDQPLHGVTPFSTADQEGLAEQLLASGQEGGLPASLAPSEANIDAVIAGQIAVGFTAGALSVDAATASTVVTAVVGGGSTADFGVPADQAPLLDAAIRSLRSFENTVANAGSTVPGIAKTENERHFDFTANAANMPTAMTATSGESGSLFINLTNFTNSRDKNRQAIVDLLNVRASLGGLDFDGTAGADLDASSVYFAGHSLGTIVGAPFVAVANESSNPDDDIVAAQLLTPGAGIVRLLENSPAFAPQILGGLQAAAGLEQGDANLETFFNVFQAALDSADPINFAASLNASGSPVLLSQVNGDQVIPNDPLANPLGRAFDAYLSGTEPFAELLGATAVTGSGTPIPLDNAAITRYLAGTHGTPVLPQGGELDVRVFTEMVTQTATVISAMGTAVVPDAGTDPDITEIVQQD
ncbi:hypothetical protein NLU14_13020 [Marinobacter sp. 71-i]|uniref:Bacterial virulence factor lipase N-terminal domain-containing protein n=1 Tax=Marinobacter iranensis TaxID=2962607 RepID=A0ABT5YBU9_9GAMM|nr:hypothetical protein [Marinobacter iranensis]MDF0751145.1 hypothetical protein [Marinobacter iranensis]